MEKRAAESELVAAKTKPNILAIDTSGECLSLALAQGEAVVAEISVAGVKRHSQVLFEHLQVLMQIAKLEIEEIDLFAAITGPGSFTGLRIGLAAIEGIATTLGRPAIGITSFDAMTVAAGWNGLVAVLIDAGRNEVFFGLRNRDIDGMPIPSGRDLVGPIELAVEELVSRLPQDRRVCLLGSGAIRFHEQIGMLTRVPGIETDCVEAFDPRTAGWSLLLQTPALSGPMARLAARKIRAGLVSPLEAYYLKPSDAELKWNQAPIQAPR